MSPKYLPYHRRKIGMVYQDYKLLSQKTVYENVAFALEVLGKSENEIRRIVPQALELVGISDKANNFPDQLSGGEQQRVALARAIVGQPKVLLADEPTGNLDIFTAKEIMRLFLKINQLGTAVILATHNRDIVNAIRKRVVVLEKGRIIRDDKQGRYLGLILATLRFSKKIFPFVGFSYPKRRRRRVDFPAPDLPRIDTNSPEEIPKLISDKAIQFFE